MAHLAAEWRVYRDFASACIAFRPSPATASLAGVGALGVLGVCAYVLYTRRGSEGHCGVDMARMTRLKRMLEQIDKVLSEDDVTAAAPAAAAPADASPEAADADPAAAPEPAASEPVNVIIGTTAMAEKDPALPRRIMEVVNGAYEYERLSLPDVINRLEMGDDGARANRVLHLAWRGDQLVGACSSTYQPPWTEEGCGHWGLVAVDVDAQGTGVASALVRAAEERLAGACEQIQIEYEHTPGEAHSERLYEWYETKLGFTCVSGRPRGTHTSFRKCRKLIPAAARAAGRRRHLQQVRAQVAAELAELEAAGEPPAAPLVGRRVVVVGVSAKPEYNGAVGIALQYDEERERYVVQLASQQGQGHVLLLRAENVAAADDGDDGGEDTGEDGEKAAEEGDDAEAGSGEEEEEEAEVDEEAEAEDRMELAGDEGEEAQEAAEEEEDASAQPQPAS